MKLFDVVAIRENLPDRRLVLGQVGTIVDILDAMHVLVEFADLDGIAYAIEPLPLDVLMPLRHEPAIAA
ncbi:MAG: DUF4926 domain-containing protein [Dechloromonas sp.]|nr:MAG: DUF4926 domain-containing protein [Dechloromonas sp.]